MTFTGLWSWEKCGESIKSLRGRLGFPDEPYLNFLGLSLSLEDGLIYDNLKKQKYPHEYLAWEIVYCILYAYSKAKPVPETSRLVTSKQLQGGQFCTVAVQRAKSVIIKTFKEKPEMLIDSAKLLGGFPINFHYGDYSVRINALPLIHILVVFTKEDMEFPASVDILFDESIKHYLSLEEAGLLAELVASRLKDAFEVLDKTV